MKHKKIDEVTKFLIQEMGEYVAENGNQVRKAFKSRADPALHPAISATMTYNHFKIMYQDAEDFKEVFGPLDEKIRKYNCSNKLN